MKHIFQPGEGETLKLGPPAAGEVVITVDPQKIPAPFAMGTETLLPGAEIPVHRHLHEDEVLFIHKGQGRATVGEETMTVVPGTMAYLPREAWHGLRNTGTGVLQATWTAAPAGIEQFFRALSQLGASPDPAAVQQVAERYGIEFRPPGGGPAPQVPSGPGRRRRRRGGRGRQRQRTGQALPSQSRQPSHETAASPSAATLPQQAAPTTTAGQRPPGQGGRRRHRRRQGRERGAAQPPRPSGSGQGSRPEAVTTPSPPPPAAAPSPKTSRPPVQRSPRRERHHRSGHVKEVYMGGRWIRVVGEGPVISPGRESA